MSISIKILLNITNFEYFPTFFTHSSHDHSAKNERLRPYYLENNTYLLQRSLNTKHSQLLDPPHSGVCGISRAIPNGIALLCGCSNEHTIRHTIKLHNTIPQTTKDYEKFIREAILAYSISHLIIAHFCHSRHCWT